MSTKRYLLTGANSGLGKACALQLAQMGYEVILVCRSEERGEAALQEIRQQSGNPNLTLMLADLASQASIHSFVDTFYQTGKYFVQGHEAQSSPESYNVRDARRLWRIREELVGQTFEYPSMSNFEPDIRRFAGGGS
jgi:NAD(P)-dependent dehydrogenase (short-subunit alcohol dehydrogenase family)